MAFAFQAGEKASPAFRRIAKEEAGRAMRELKNSRRTRDERIHEARKSCKRLRALLKLLPSKKGKIVLRENRVLRDAARRLSGTRDAQVLRQLYTELVKNTGAGSAVLPEASRLFPLPAVKGNSIPLFLQTLKDFQQRIKGWDLPKLDQKTLDKGLCRSRQRTRHSMRRALREESDRNLHEWRKQSKIRGYHLDLFRHRLSKKQKKRRKGVKELGDLLGRDHDLALLEYVLGQKRTLPASKRRKLLESVCRERKKLLKKIRAQGGNN